MEGIKHSEITTKGKTLKAGDLIKLIGEEENASAINQLRDRKYSYQYVKFRETTELFGETDVPKLMRGFEDRIEYFEEKGGYLIAYTEYLRIILHLALPSEIITIEKRQLGEREAQHYYNLIVESKEIHEVFHMGFITYYERNVKLVEVYSKFMWDISGREKWRERQRLEQGMEMNLNEIEKKFANSWNSLLQTIDNWNHQVGFLHGHDDQGCSFYRILVGFIGEIRQRGLDKKIGASRVLGGLILTRAKVISSPKNCTGHIEVKINTNETIPDNPQLTDTQQTFKISIWMKNTGHHQIKTNEPFKNKEFTNTLDELTKQPIC